MSHQVITAPWGEYDILQSQWLRDMPEIWCHILETAVHLCVRVCAHVSRPNDVCVSRSVLWDETQKSL